ncbi:MAG: zf-HC2 domain-containing protein [Actinomycetota bacterium]
MTQVLDDITCRELVELITDYLEGALSDADRTRFAVHLEICGACRTYIEQMRLTIEASGRAHGAGPGALRPRSVDGRLPRLEPQPPKPKALATSA